jgi:hypothetical protein
MTDTVGNLWARKPAQLSADAGYCSEASFQRGAGGACYLATSRAAGCCAAPRHHQALVRRLPALGPRPCIAKLKARQSLAYRLRKNAAGPWHRFKSSRRIARQFLLRSMNKVWLAVWGMVCAVPGQCLLRPQRRSSA